MTAKTKIVAADVGTGVQDAAAMGCETLESVVKAGTEAAARGYEKAVALTRGQVETAVKAGTAAFRSYEEVMAFNRETFEAVVRSGSLMVQGWQDVNRALLGMARQNLDDGLAAGKALSEARSVADILDVQRGLARAGLDRMVGESTRISDLAVRVTEEAMVPLSGRMSAAVERLAKVAA